MCHQKGDFFVRKKVLSLLLAFCMIVMPFTVAYADGGADNGTPKEIIYIDSSADLVRAIQDQQDNQTWIFREAGEFDAKNTEEGSDGVYKNESVYPYGFAFPVFVDNLTIQKADSVQGDVIITSSYVATDANWHNQNFITVYGEGLTIQDVSILANQNTSVKDADTNELWYDNLANKAIEFTAESSDFTLRNVKLLPLTNEDGERNSGSIWVGCNNVGSSSIINVEMASFISGGDYDGTLTVDGLTQDFTDFNRAGVETDEGYYLYGIRPTAKGSLKVSDFTILADDSVNLAEQVFSERLPAGTTVQLQDGTYSLDKKVTIDKDVTIEGMGEKVVIQGQEDQHHVFFEVTGGKVTFDNLTLEEFGGASPTVQEIGVITVPESASDVELTVKNTTIKDFVRAGIDIGAGKFTISNCTIDCENTYIRKEAGDNYLTKGLCIGKGSKKAEGTLDQVAILNAQSGYSTWSAAAIEIFQNSDVAITNTEVSLCDYGIWVDSYDPSSASGPTVASVTLGEGNNIVPNEEKPKESVFVAVNSKYSYLSAQVSITGGSYDGPVYIYDYTKGECLSNTDDTFLSVTGGTFKNFESEEDKGRFSTYIAPGNKIGVDGTVVPDTATAAAVVDGVGYPTLAGAVAALKDGSTMTIQPGSHDVTAERAEGTYGSCFIIDKDNVTIKAADPADKPVLYGFSNKFSGSTTDGGINGQDTIYVSGEKVTLENLVIMPLGGIGENANTWQKTVEVTKTATGFTMTGCETTPNTMEKEDVENSMADAAGLVHISTNDAAISENSFGAGTTICAGWIGSTVEEGYYQVDASQNYWGEGVTEQEIGAMLDGPVKVTSYYADEEMENLVVIGGVLVTNSKQLQAAIDNAADGEATTIVCAPGTYDGVIFFRNKNITVRAQYPAYRNGEKEEDKSKLSRFTGTFNTSERTTDDAFRAEQTVVIEGFAFSGNGLKVGNNNYNTVGKLEVRNCTMEFGENLAKKDVTNYNQYNYFVKLSGNKGTPYAAVTVENNYISGKPAQTPFAITPIQLWDVKNAVVRNNVIELQNAENSQAINISMLDPEAEITVSGNEITGAGAGGIYVTTWMLGGTACKNGETKFTGVIDIRDNTMQVAEDEETSKYPIFLGYENNAATADNAYGIVAGQLIIGGNTNNDEEVQATLGRPENAESIYYVATFVSNNETIGRIAVTENEENQYPVTLLPLEDTDTHTFVGWHSNVTENTYEFDEQHTSYEVSLLEALTTFTAVWDEIDDGGDKPSGGSSSDDSSVGSPLPTVPTEPGEPTDPTDPSTPSGFVSDTTNDLTVNGTYQFRITSLDGTIPFLTVDNANFRVEFASQEGNDFFFKIHAQGAAGSTTVVSVNGVRLLTATVGGSATGVISDTTAPFTVKKGETYQFRLTASERPSFAAGSASFTVEYAGQIGSDYFYKVYAAGNVGDGCGFYINGEASPVAVATIA